MSKYELNVPVVNYHKVNLTREHLIDLLVQEQKKLCGFWDMIVKHQGKYVYYDQGYGSHDIGEKYGNEVDESTVENYLNIGKVINYLRSVKDK